MPSYQFKVAVRNMDLEPGDDSDDMFVKSTIEAANRHEALAKFAIELTEAAEEYNQLGY
jgi:hypothetical protein